MMKRKKKRKLDLKRPVERPRMALGVIFRVFLIGSVSVVASSYALYRHYFIPRPSMLVPAPPPSASALDPAGGEVLPAPELIPFPPQPSAPAPPAPAPSSAP